MKVLIACEESQAICLAMRKHGHEAYSCDLQECSGNHPEWHIQGDALLIINGNCTFQTMNDVFHTVEGTWDLLIAHPPCTFLSNAGACRLYPRKGEIDYTRYAEGLKAKAFFMKFYNANCPRIAIENPLPSRIFELPPVSQWIQPYEYQYTDDKTCFHPWTKKTGLWLKNLPLLVPVSPNAVPLAPYVPSGTSRKIKDKYGVAKRGADAKNRAKTFPGIARAMSEQWLTNTERGCASECESR